MSKNLLIWILVLLLLVPIVFAPPPFAESFEFTEGLTIYTPIQYYFEKDKDHTFGFQVFNSSDGVTFTNSSVNCSFFFVDDYGSILFQSSVGHDGSRWAIELISSNFSELGHYNYGIKCITSDGSIGGLKPTEIEVTTSGNEESTTPVALFYLGSIAIIMVLFGISIYGIIKITSSLGKYIFIVLTYTFFIALTYVTWRMAEVFIVSSPFLVWFLKFLFMFSMWIFLPFFLFSIIYLLYSFYKIKQIENLMAKGITEDEARMRVKK